MYIMISIVNVDCIFQDFSKQKNNNMSAIERHFRANAVTKTF